MKLDYSSLQKAVKSLSEAIENTTDESSILLSDSQKRTMRAGVIQNFEFCYELSWKMLKRQLKQEEGDIEINHLSRKDLYRLAAQKGVLNSPEKWFVFHRARNETSHTYNESKADEVYLIAVEFVSFAKQLLENLLAR